jgi:hypothetical protein
MSSFKNFWVEFKTPPNPPVKPSKLLYLTVEFTKTYLNSLSVVKGLDYMPNPTVTNISVTHPTEANPLAITPYATPMPIDQEYGGSQDGFKANFAGSFPMTDLITGLPYTSNVVNYSVSPELT